jgi:gliding motility-associated-like protein
MSGTYSVAVTVNGCTSADDTVAIVVDACNDDSLIIPEGFSPNGDGINDYFELVGIDAYPDNKVTIFNRWGNLIYESAGYNNGSIRWEGNNSGELSTGNGAVPEATYFYVIDLGDGSPIRSGYIYLNRQ